LFYTIGGNIDKVMKRRSRWATFFRE